MTWTGFRPSDDACEYGYLLPSNMHAVTALHRLQEIASQVIEFTMISIECQRYCTVKPW